MEGLVWLGIILLIPLGVVLFTLYLIAWVVWTIPVFIIHTILGIIFVILGIFF